MFCVSALNSKNDGVVNDVHLFAEDIEIEPNVGMKFENENEVFDFYKRYAYHVGFPVRKRTSRKNKEGVVTYIAFTCGRESRINSNTSTTMKPQPTGQTGCKARLTACSDVAGVWKITGVHLEHNHQTSPTKSRAFRCYRQLNAHVKRQLEVNDIADIPLHKSYNSVVVEAGGYEKMTFIEKDCRNYIDKVRKLRLGEGDAAAIQAYFSKMQFLSPGFFFSLDLDDEGRLKNIFWADNRCRQAYKEFGDVMTFDTTYLTNKYDMPFAPFVGVNHHGHSTLLGCGLLSSEDTETFVWLFKIWLEFMEFKSPQGIITDQDRAMQNAIEARENSLGSMFSQNFILGRNVNNPTKESMNSFFDGYVHSKTSLKQFVEQYERALRSKVEKEFQADFKSFSQMVPCVTQFDIERQFQSAYTIAKFKEFQQELTGKMYCDIEYSEDGCNLFEFRGIICRHAIAVLIRNKFSVVPEQYILRRWRKDVSRLYMRVKINYNGWITTPGQLNYEKLCEAFTNVADMAADNDEETQKLLEWIESKASDLAISKLRSGCGRNLVSPQSMQVQSDHVDDTTQASIATCKVLDPKYTKTKGAPKKLRKKGPLEKCSKKSKVLVKSRKEKNFQPKNIEYNNVIIQPGVQNSVMNQISFSQQLIGVHHHPWNIDYGVHLVSNYGVDQELTTLCSSKWCSNEDEVIGSNGVINNEAC
ncbi:protein FAR-RED IMPAIRED RESPONSE 1-like [Henckelia pumila]|uniref:protein FAR-RED IMPAIRED RESPONSE 1-like n=1 Tax=Henckelia pumila TaxID=405737 RepID=UPI003C6E7935